MPYWLVFNVGDSRTYRLSQGDFAQVSVDHSEVQELVDAGFITAAEALTHPRRHVVTRALGTGTDTEADFWLVPVEEGDRILVCSDGLSGELSDEQIHRALSTLRHPQDAVDSLIQAALRSGGRDNITVVVVDASNVNGGAGGETLGNPSNGPTQPRKTPCRACRRPRKSLPGAVAATRPTEVLESIPKEFLAARATRCPQLSTHPCMRRIMVSTTYSTGSWLGIVRSGSVIVLEAHTDPAIVTGLWDFLGQEPTIHGVLNEVTRQFGTGLTGLPDFAIVVQSDRLHAILRGEMTLLARTGEGHGDGFRPGRHHLE